MIIDPYEKKIDSHCLAVEGIGFGALAVATLGYRKFEIVPSSEINPYCLAVEGIGFGSISVATDGVIWSERKPQIVGGIYQPVRYEEPEKKRHRIVFQITVNGKTVRKVYKIDSEIGQVQVKATLISHKRSNARKLLRVEATLWTPSR